MAASQNMALPVYLAQLDESADSQESWLNDVNEIRSRTTFLNQLRTAFWIFDVDHTRIIRANEAALEFWQAKNEDDILGRDLGANVPVAVRERDIQYRSDFEQYDAVYDMSSTFYPNGMPKTISIRTRGIVLASGRTAIFCEALAEVETEPENQRSIDAILHTSVMISLFDNDGRELFANPASRRVFSGVDRSLYGYFARRKDVDKIMSQLSQSGEAKGVFAIQVASEIRWHDVTARYCHDVVTGVEAIQITQIDVTELKNARDQARYLSTRDPLTGLYNRHFVQTELGAFLRQREDFQKGAILHFIDLDRFKQINDTLGHEAGDAILEVVAHRLRSETGPGAKIARLGGDEFLVLTKSSAEFHDLSERLLQRLNEPAAVLGHHLQLSASIGVSLFPQDGKSIDELMRHADMALYHAKEHGRARVHAFSPALAQAAHDRLTLEREMRNGLENREFELYFQPRFETQSGRVVSAEALVRWQHPIRGELSPAIFIDLAEETGLIEPLGLEVFRLAAAQIANWQSLGIDIGVSVNVSRRQLDSNFVDLTEEILAVAGVKADRVELEVTESALASDAKRCVAGLTRLAARGHGISIDDFGTGYSNLGRITELPISAIKIDRSFTQMLPAGDALVRMILDLAGHLGCRVVAEGVETRAQMDWLKKHKCHELQGFLLGRPKPAIELTRTLMQQAELAVVSDADR